MAILLGNLLSFLEDFFVVKFGIVPALEIEHPALNFLALRVYVD
jgi:hypothetical protein